MVVYCIKNRKSIKWPPLTKPIVIFLGVGLWSLIFNMVRYPILEVAIGSLYLLRWTAYTSIYFAAYLITKNKPSWSNRLLTYLGLAGIAAALFGIVQYALYPNLRNLMYLGWDPHEYRIFGTYFDSGFTGLVYVVTILLLISQSKKIQVKNWRYYWYRAGILISYVALALTYSRSAYTALIAAGASYSFMNKSIKPLLISLIVIIPLFFFLPKPAPTAEGADLTRTTSAYARVSNYEQSLAIIKDHFVFGIGFNMLRYENRNRQFVPDYEWEEHNAAAGLDNSFLFIFAATGIVGLAVYLYLLFTMAVNTQTLLSITTLTAIVVHSLFNNSLFYPWILIWMFVLFGITHASGNR
jgi:O-antigen ligase